MSYRCFIVVVFPIKLSLCKCLIRVRNCSNNMVDKTSPRAENAVVFCCSVVYSDNTGSNLAIKNGLYSFEPDYTWKDVLKELDEKPTLPFCKADTADVGVSSKLNGSKKIYPDIDEAIEVVKNFNIDLKYVTFKICKAVATFEQKTKSSGPTVNAFQRSFQTQTLFEKKKKKLKDTESPRFTGICLQC